MSNTMLTRSEKTTLFVALAIFCRAGGEIVSNEETGITVAVMPVFPGSNTVKVSTSVMSPDEDTFRDSVGKMHALDNMGLGNFIVMPTPDDLESFAESLSECSF